VAFIDNVSGINRRNLLYTLLALGLVIVLLFLPEILTLSGMHKEERLARSDDDDERAKLEIENAQRSSEETSEPSFLSNLRNAAGKSVEKVSKMVSRERTRREYSEELATDMPSYPGRVMRLSDVERELEEQDRIPIGSDTRATWSMLQRGQYNEILLSSRKRALTIAANLNAEQTRSKYALINFATGVGFILNQPTGLMSAPEALAYLEDLQLKATRALEDDGVKHTLYKSWRDVSLDTARAADNVKMVASAGKPLDARYRGSIAMVLTEVTRKLNSRVVTVHGVTYGKDIVRVEVYRNGIYVLDGLLKGTQNDFRQFYFRAPDGTGIFSIRSINKDNYYFEKRYQLLPEDGLTVTRVESEGEEGESEDLTVPF
jgi:hypothetical protein